ncbi:hypothetical protein BDB00DRAFT_822481 [Zychaea mexicana]|uniref:uncharacterized protein n=1 Tax=Zychaea mexicana TaxID=64656 RepID=UPI0022FF3FA3|nr:uncharacterized protein BDB00DRAFT_822481 [Zychaea mexicana]KAI9493553.1 hypothetical protein BDB00DRAFT_822481 [Zychaea mexicana]
MGHGKDTNPGKPPNGSTCASFTCSSPPSHSPRPMFTTVEPLPSIATATATLNLGGPMRRPHRTHTTPRYDPLSSSNNRLSATDRTFIDFTRCLYQTKAIVKGLQQFSNSICPALRLSPFNGHSASSSLHDPRLSSEDFVRHVNQYLDNTFQKVSRLCKMLLLILERIERSGEVKRERIDSFRTEVWEQMRIATYTKETLIRYIQQHIDSASPSIHSVVTSPASDSALTPSSTASYPPSSSAV